LQLWFDGNVSAGAAFTARVWIVDPEGNPIRTRTDSVTLSLGSNPAGGTLAGTLTVRAVDGEARFSDLSIDQMGAGYALIARAPGLAEATGPAFTVSGPAAHLRFDTSPERTLVGYRMRYGITVEATDVLDNVATGFNGLVTILIGANPGGGSLTGTTTSAAYQGRFSSWDLVIDRIGTGYTLVASAPGTSPATSPPFEVTPATDVIDFRWSHFDSSGGGCGVVSAATGGMGQPDVIGPGGWCGMWSPDGSRIAFPSADGTCVMTADGLQNTCLRLGLTGVGGLAWSPDGTLLALSAVRGGSPGIYVADADGSGITQVTIMGLAGNPTWSPDGTMIAFDAGDREVSEIYVVNADGSGLRQLTNNSVGDEDPDWSPDGARIVFTRARGGGRDIFAMAADGSQVTRLTSEGALFASSMPAWSPDGSRIAFAGRLSSGSPADIYVMSADGSNVALLTRPQPLQFSGYSWDGDYLWDHSFAPVWRPRQP
jgi:WD40 repeat protein